MNRRRAPVVIIGTAAGLAGILSYHTHPTNLTSVAAASPLVTGTGRRAGSSGPSPSTTTPSATIPPATSTAPPTTSPPATTAPATQTATGPMEQYGYGQLAVRVTVAGKRITNVVVTGLQVADYSSQYIAQQAIPLLKREVMSAQSANIQGVTGATYTSEAYAQSLQSALQKVTKG